MLNRPLADRGAVRSVPRRWPPVAIGVALVAGLLGLTPPASAQVKSWNAAGGNWGLAGNWLPVGLPGPANQVFVGNTAAAENAFLTVNVDALAQSLTITDGMSVNTSGGQLIVTGALSVTGRNEVDIITYPSRLRVYDNLAFYDTIVGQATVDDGAWIQLEGGQLVVSGLLTIGSDGALIGEGTVVLPGDISTVMLLNGSLGPGTGGMTLIMEGDGRIDLDGSVGGDRTINITGAMIDGTDFASLEIIGTGLTDAFDDTIWLSSSNQLTMALDEPWSLGPLGVLRFSSGDSGLPSFVNGAPLTILGELEFLGATPYAYFTAPVTFAPSAVAMLGPGDRLRLNGATTVEGGTFTVGLDGRIDFWGTTLLEGGAFATVSPDPDDGFVQFNGPTTYDGSVSFVGFARQEGDATVVGPTTIDAEGATFDMDGVLGTNAWSIANALTISAQSLDQGGSVVDSTITIAGTFAGRLTVNLDIPGAFWYAHGFLDLGGVAAILTTRIEGTPLVVSGDMRITNAVRITADTLLPNGGEVEFASESARLRLTGVTTVASGFDFSGGGNLENDGMGVMRLLPAADLGATDLGNAGVLEVGAAIGVASVDDLTLEATSVWNVDIGGPTQGTEHDLLVVTGSDNQLGGALEVRLIDLGSGIYTPRVGEKFYVMAAPPVTLDGVFANDPVTFIPNASYHWTIGYETGEVADSVTLTVDAIVPCLGDLDGDGKIDGADLGLLLASWGPCRGCDADLDGSGAVDGADLGVLLAAWGPCPSK